MAIVARYIRRWICFGSGYNSEVHLDRFFRWLNILIGVALVAALTGVYWFFWRPLPQTSGAASAPVSNRATVTRDRLGAPTIHAANEDDLLFVQGYTTAQERLWQMDTLRRFAAGDLSEIVGPAGLEADRESRRLRMRRIAEQIYATMPAQDRARFAAYARGVNFFIETHRTSLPFEFAVLGYDPRPWSVVDGILIGLHMYRDLTTTWPEKVQKNNLLASGDREKVNFLFPIRAGTEILPGTDVQPGSNAWAVAGSHTASGRPLLSNDMHLEYSIPGIWFMVGLQTPGMHVAGVSLPGVPGVIVGHNDRIAWGFTNLGFDVQDLYVERFDDRSGKYLFKGQVEQAQLERDIIRVKGQAPAEVRQWVTRHGPLIVDNGKERIALKWAAAEPGNFQFPFLEIDAARNWADFTKALARFPGPGQNVVYADRDGNIGYHAAGRLPIRRNYRGDVPVDGASGNFEWDGYIPFEELPSAYNPAGGLIVTANQNPFPANYAYNVTGKFASPHRSTQIHAMLLATKGLRPEDMLKVQKDVYSGFDLYLAKSIVAACDRRKTSNVDLTDAIQLLRSWNGQMEKDQAAPLIAALAFQHLRKAVADVASPGNGGQYETQMSVAVVERLLRERPAGWFHDYDETLVRCLLDAVEEGRRGQGRYVKKWIYGKYMQLLVGHPIGHKLPLVAPYFDVGPVAMSGGSTTVKQTTRKLGPSERFTADLGDWEKSLLNLPIGESGHVLSRHYKDQWDAYYGGTSFAMPFDKADVKDTVTFEPK
jgi:penicillin amidase